MARVLITSWSDHQAAIDRLLAMVNEKIAIYDEDLLTLKLETPSRLDHLKRPLQGRQQDALRIALRNGDSLRSKHPQLSQLLGTYSHRASALQTSEQLAHLRDSMFLVDGKHALIRFDRDQPRSKLLIDETDELRPYLNRFEEIWSAGGEPIVSTTLGL